mmetsp:Transcript_45017/g.95798  ORF Transcript_45017/g.95798 Transcript_45017/m.95798 type:complete len:375 (+) Transcript_45017:198-1322(+)
MVQHSVIQHTYIVNHPSLVIIHSLLLVFQVHLVPQPPGREPVLAKEKCPQYRRNRSHGDEQRPEPVILPPEDVAVAHHQRLRTPQPLHGEVGHDAERERGPRRDGSFDVPVQLAKVGQRSRAHPHHEVLVHHPLDGVDEHGVRLVQVLRGFVVGVVVPEAVPVLVLVRILARPRKVPLVGRSNFRAIAGGQRAAIAVALPALREFESVRLLVLPLQIRRPSDPRLDHGRILDLLPVGPLDLHQLDDVVEQRVGDESAGVDGHVPDLAQRLAAVARHLVLLLHPPQQLVLIVAVDVLSVVLVEVVQLVVHQYRGFQVPLVKGDLHLYLAGLARLLLAALDPHAVGTVPDLAPGHVGGSAVLQVGFVDTLDLDEVC